MQSWMRWSDAFMERLICYWQPLKYIINKTTPAKHSTSNIESFYMIPISVSREYQSQISLPFSIGKFHCPSLPQKRECIYLIHVPKKSFLLTPAFNFKWVFPVKDSFVGLSLAAQIMLFRNDAMIFGRSLNKFWMYIFIRKCQIGQIFNNVSLPYTKIPLDIYAIMNSFSFITRPRCPWGSVYWSRCL